MKNAIATAATSAYGTLKVIENNSDLKPFNVGRASLLGLLSSYTAKAGFEGPDDVFLGNTGFLNMMADKYDLHHLKMKKNDECRIKKVYFKKHAACRHCHSPIDATLKIKSKHSIEIGEIKEIRVRTYNLVIGKHDHSKVSSVSSAKMSIPFSVAITLLNGKAGIHEFSEKCIQDSSATSLMNKIRVIADDKLSALVPNVRSAIVEIITEDGKCYSEHVDHPKGEPENPLTDQELFDKFKSLASYANKTEEEAEKIIDCVMNLEDKLDELYPLL